MHQSFRLVLFTGLVGILLVLGGGTAHAVCGDGTIDLGEDCDEMTANGTPSSCCAVDCLFRPALETCRDSAGPCDPVETCTGSDATCPADELAPDLTVCRAASGSCDVDETCNGVDADCPVDGFAADDTSCTDGQFCNGEETCQAGVCEPGTDPCVTTCDEGTDACGSLCGAQPAPSCLVDGGSVFLLKQNADPTRSKLKWKWGKGQPFEQAVLGSPLTTTTYELCIYDTVGSTPQFVTSLTLEPNGLWVDSAPKGFSYKDKTLASDGIRKIKLKPGVIDKTKVNLDAGRANLPVVTPATLTSLFTVEPAVTVELVNSEGACWSSDFAINDVKVNKDTQFKAIAK